MNEAKLFRPHALAKAPIVRESRLIADLTMPMRNWNDYEAPAWERLAKPNPFRDRELPAFLRRQAA